MRIEDRKAIALLFGVSIAIIVIMFLAWLPN